MGHNTFYCFYSRTSCVATILDHPPSIPVTLNFSQRMPITMLSAQQPDVLRGHVSPSCATGRNKASPSPRAQRVDPNRKQSQLLGEPRLQLSPHYLQAGLVKCKSPIRVAAGDTAVLGVKDVRTKCVGRQVLLDDDPAAGEEQWDEGLEVRLQGRQREVVQAPLVEDQVVLRL